MPETRHPIADSDPLASSRAFGRVEAPLRALLSERMRRRDFAKGERLLEQGTRGDELLLLIEGSAVVSLRRAGDAGGAEPVLGFVGPGEVLGEMALVTDAPRSASAFAESAGHALVLTRADFESLARLHPEVAHAVTQIVADRLGTKSTDALTHKRLGPFVVERCIGRGAMAMVYAAHDRTTGERVALKMMSHRLAFDPAERARFDRESRLLERLDHPNVARRIRRFRAFGTEFLALEFCDGASLADVLTRNGLLAEEQVLAIAGQLAAALRALHAVGVIHRDLKPGNVVLTRAGTIKLIDFGLSATRDEIARGEDGATATDGVRRGIAGTPLYMAPEQFEGIPADEKSDLYALGVLLYELAAGEPPFLATTLADLIDEKSRFELPERSTIGGGVSVTLADLLDRLLAPRRDQRAVALAEIAVFAAPLPADLIAEVLSSGRDDRIVQH